MHKKLTIELTVDGAPAVGIKVMVSGCTELETGAIGAAFFLVTEPQVSVLVDGKEVFVTALDALPPKLHFAKAGGGWKAA